MTTRLVTCEYLDTVGIQYTTKDFIPYNVDTMAYFREASHPEYGEGDLYAVWLE